MKVDTIHARLKRPPGDEQSRRRRNSTVQYQPIPILTNCPEEREIYGGNFGENFLNYMRWKLGVDAHCFF